MTTESPAPADLSNLISNAMGDEEFIGEMISMFVSQAATQIAALKGQCSDGENHNWVEVSHALKGTAGSVGAELMRTLCADAQKMDNATADARRAIIADIESQYAVVKAWLITNGHYKE